MKIDVVNGLRGLAILAVIQHHVFGRFTPPGFGEVTVGGWRLLPFAPLSNGWAGVNLFFILSGFVLFLPYARGTRTMDGRAHILTFFRRRARRLVPLFYLCTLLGMGVFWTMRGPEPAMEVVRNALLMLTATFNFTVDMWMPKYNFVLWSLGIEIWFSLVFPLLVLVCNRAGPYRLYIVAAALALSIRVMAMDPFIIQYDNLYLNPVKDSFIGRLDDFVLGMMLAAVFVRLHGRRVSQGLVAAGAAAGLATLYATFMLWDYIAIGAAPKALVPFMNNLMQAGFAVLMLSLLFMDGGFFRKLFDNVPLQLTGMMCYSLYVWHVLPLWLFVGGHFTPGRLALYFAIVFGVSALTYRYVEFGHVRDWRALFLPRFGDRAVPVPETVNLK